MAAAASLTLGFSAWGFGGIPAWSLHVLLAGGIATIALAAVPLPDAWNGRAGDHGNLANVKRLLAFPVFWAGLAFLVYILIQGFNPAYTVVSEGTRWWVEGTGKAIGWLPSGVEAPYERMNAFRVAAGFGGAWALVCGLWVGVRRRPAALAVLWFFALNGAGMAVVGIVQELTGASEVLWSARSNNRHFWGSYFYRNQGAGYLNLILALCGVLYFYHAERTRRKLRASGPHSPAFLLALFTAGSVALSASRGGIIFGACVAACLVALLLARAARAAAEGGSWKAIVVVAALFLGFGVFFQQTVDWSEVKQRFARLEEKMQEPQKVHRMISTKATWDMARSAWVAGYGAGGFRYIFPIFQQEYPEIFYQRYHRDRGWIGRRFYRYAHNDIVQFLAEYGAVGCGLLIASIVYWFWSLLWRSGGYRSAGVMAIAGAVAAFGHAFFEFIFQSPSYLMAFSALLAGVAKLLCLEHRRHRPRTAKAG